MRQYVSIKGLRSIILVFRVWPLDISLENSKYNSPVSKKNWLQVAKYDESYTVFFEQLIRTNGLVLTSVKTDCRESGNMGSIPDE